MSLARRVEARRPHARKLGAGVCPRRAMPVRAFALHSPQADAMVAQYGAMGLGLVEAAPHELVGVLNAKLNGDGAYVGEVTVLGMVKGAAFAERFFVIFRDRSEVCVSVGG